MLCEKWLIKGVDKSLIQTSNLDEFKLQEEDFDKKGEYKDSRYTYKLKSKKEALLDKLLYSKIAKVKDLFKNKVKRVGNKKVTFLSKEDANTYAKMYGYSTSEVKKVSFENEEEVPIPNIPTGKENIQCPECGEKFYIENPKGWEFRCPNCGYEGAHLIKRLSKNKLNKKSSISNPEDNEVIEFLSNIDIGKKKKGFGFDIERMSDWTWRIGEEVYGVNEAYNILIRPDTQKDLIPKSSEREEKVLEYIKEAKLTRRVGDIEEKEQISVSDMRDYLYDRSFYTNAEIDILEEKDIKRLYKEQKEKEEFEIIDKESNLRYASITQDIMDWFKKQVDSFKETFGDMTKEYKEKIKLLYREFKNKLEETLESLKHWDKDKVNEAIRNYLSWGQQVSGVPAFGKVSSIEGEDYNKSTSVERISKLIQKVNPKTDKKEWALVGKDDTSKVLKYFGESKPSKDVVEKREKEVQFFKHQSKLNRRKILSISSPLTHARKFMNDEDYQEFKKLLAVRDMIVSEIGTQEEYNKIRGLDDKINYKKLHKVNRNIDDILDRYNDSLSKYFSPKEVAASTKQRKKVSYSEILENLKFIKGKKIFDSSTPEYNELVEISKSEEGWQEFLDEMARYGTTIEYDSIGDTCVVFNYTEVEDPLEVSDLIGKDVEIDKEGSITLT